MRLAGVFHLRDGLTEDTFFHCISITENRFRRILPRATNAEKPASPAN
jgi:hypothetical protein